LEEFAVSYALTVSHGAFGDMNEGQRDKWFQKETREYVIGHPKLALDLAIRKLWVFSSMMGPLGGLLLAVAILGCPLAIMRKRLDLLAFGMCILIFAAPYALIITYFPRYRLPVEPMVVVAAVMTIRELWRALGFGSRAREATTRSQGVPSTTAAESYALGRTALN
jgi:hypothetical protein